ncbi:MAG: helix-turn-helix domain-containing protein [Clostridia bacterium]|nr:helix-turn-helix domain-containing protein [Clostridia bacterium]
MRKKLIYIRDWNQLPPVLTVEEVALLMRTNEQVVRKFAREKVIPAVKFGKSWRFEKSALRDYMEGGRSDVKPTDYVPAV